MSIHLVLYIIYTRTNYLDFTPIHHGAGCLQVSHIMSNGLRSGHLAQVAVERAGDTEVMRSYGVHCCTVDAAV